jgi:hypothetical protein
MNDLALAAALEACYRYFPHLSRKDFVELVRSQIEWFAPALAESLRLDRSDPIALH